MSVGASAQVILPLCPGRAWWGSKENTHTHIHVRTQVLLLRFGVTIGLDQVPEEVSSRLGKPQQHSGPGWGRGWLRLPSKDTMQYREDLGVS